MNRSNMNRLNRLFLVTLCALLLSACGGSENATSEVELDAAAPEPQAETKKAYNPLESQQQLIRDANAIQGILDKDAEKKKKALGEAN